MGRWKERGAAALRWARAFGLKHFLPLCFLVATLIALLWPAPGKAVASVLIFGSMHLVSTLNIIVVFTISGLVLKTEDIKKALGYWPGVVFGFASILLLTPCLGFALRELPLSPPEFSLGLTIFAVVPTTLGVGEALVRASKGNAALALLLLVGTNALGIATMPPWLRLMLSGADGLSVSVDPLPLFYKLLATVLAPALAGKAARELIPPVGRFATRYKLQLGLVNTLMLAMIIWQTLSGAQDVLVHQKFLDIFVVICCAVIMHAVYLALNFMAATYLLRMPLRERIGACIMASQKSAPVAVTVISYLTNDVTEQGLLAVPCIVGQLAQIFMGAALSHRLAALVTRRESLAVTTVAASAGTDNEKQDDGDRNTDSSKSSAEGSGGEIRAVEAELTGTVARDSPAADMREAGTRGTAADSGPVAGEVAAAGAGMDADSRGGMPGSSSQQQAAQQQAAQKQMQQQQVQQQQVQQQQSLQVVVVGQADSVQPP